MWINRKTIKLLTFWTLIIILFLFRTSLDYMGTFSFYTGTIQVSHLCNIYQYWFIFC
jgi:hypothetical protein